MDGLMWTTALLIYALVTLSLYIFDVQRSHGPTFSEEQHRANALVGSILWPTGLVLILSSWGLALVVRSQHDD